MAKKNQKRKLVGLVCEGCKQRHYYTPKNSMNTPDKIELKKYCKVQRTRVSQIETKKNLGRNEA